MKRLSPPTRRPRKHLTLAGLALAALATAACIPIFSGGAFQTLKLIFELSLTISAGQSEVVQVTAFPQGVRTKKTFVQISGALEAPAGQSLPGKVRVVAALENPQGRTVQKVSITASIRDDGTFRASKKVKKNIGAGDIMTVTTEPLGGDLIEGTTVTLCVDMVKKKSALSSLPACVENDDNGGSSSETLTALQSDFLTPTCARSGCHDAASSSAGLVLSPGQSHGELVNVPSSQVASLDRVTPNDPENSYLIKKLRGDSDIQGDRMPRGGPFLSEAEMNRFISWINAGAPNN